MIGDLAPNDIARPYRGLSVQDADFELTDQAIRSGLIGREAYRRTEYVALRNQGACALVGVEKQSYEPLFSPITAVRIYAGPQEVIELHSAATDTGNASALARAVTASAVGLADAYVVTGMHQHVNFIWRPSPLMVRVMEVVPPEPAKLLWMCEQVLSYDEDLPPIKLELDAVDISDLMAHHPAECHLLPCRGSGMGDAPNIQYLDTRPRERQEWLLIGCERSVQFHQHFYGEVPQAVDICPRRRSRDSVLTGRTPLLTKCCLLERGIEVEGDRVVVPWGARLDEVRAALRLIVGVDSSPSV